MRSLLGNDIPPPKYILESFVYIEPRWMDELDKATFLLDSGAFTFLSKQPSGIDWPEYVRKYAAFIKKYEIRNYFELDIYKIIGIDQTEQLRDMVEQITGIKCIPVWHRHLGIDYLERLSSEYDYIAFGGFAIGDIKPSEYAAVPKLLKICEKNYCRVHGLGFTNAEWLRKCPFYSIDSSTWITGQRFGKLFSFADGKLRSITPPKGYRGKRTVWKESLRAWIQYAEYAEGNL